VVGAISGTVKTETRELKHFVMECNYDPDEDDENISFDYALEFSNNFENLTESNV